MKKNLYKCFYVYAFSVDLIIITLWFVYTTFYGI